MEQFKARPIRIAFSTTSLFNLGSAPGKAKETVDILVLGLPPKVAPSGENILDCVFNCTCITKPETNSKLTSGFAVIALINGYCVDYTFKDKSKLYQNCEFKVTFCLWHVISNTHCTQK